MCNETFKIGQNVLVRRTNQRDFQLQLVSCASLSERSHQSEQDRICRCKKTSSTEFTIVTLRSRGACGSSQMWWLILSCRLVEMACERFFHLLCDLIPALLSNHHLVDVLPRAYCDECFHCHCKIEAYKSWNEMIAITVWGLSVEGGTAGWN